MTGTGLRRLRRIMAVRLVAVCKDSEIEIEPVLPG